MNYKNDKALAHLPEYFVRRLPGELCDPPSGHKASGTTGKMVATVVQV
jgi:hypothetical protein